ncbi:MAG TPA: response regulator transcription factor [Terriglobales bacterium]|nr:response regulator transcription factor [Terriglobales bacterium]
MNTTLKQKLLVVEDEQALGMVLTDRLCAEGYSVELASDGVEGLSKATDSPFDLILLDVMLPRKNGFDVCRDIRAAGVITPVLMLTAHGQSADKVQGLKIGADDYVTKPFDMAELMARVEALLRRAPGRPPGLGVFTFASLRIDIPATEVLREGKPVQLSAREFQLLRYLIERRGSTVSRGEILKEVWGYSAETFTRTVDVHVASLRQKLESDPRQPQLIATVPGFGYKFVA